jgi:probable O-glycosylation ligase (exosortase A-associated)
MFMRSRNKIKFLPFLVLGSLVVVYFASTAFLERMNTIKTYQADSSAQVRLAVWQWTLEFAASHPFGGGFNSFVVNVIRIPGADGSPGGETQYGRAFHSSYFEMLGEQGWVGLFLFVGGMVNCILFLRKVAKKTRNIPELEWCADFADAIQAGFVAFMVCGAFVGIAFQPFIWYFFVLAISLRAYVQRVEASAGAPETKGWRAAATTGNYQPGGAVAAQRGG